MAPVVLVLVLIIPFPTIVLDILMAANLILAILMLSAVIFNGKQRRRRIFLREKNSPFCFPVAFLLCTLFMVAVNIASGRPILTRGAERKV
ncbi:MAG: FHIPEP family type III secretion protein [Treponema sp.]|nr:FHIPEP family type III secretion protein [Treponema sp.]